jgi:EAL domain-containing protein (putative c-di-GMP-specific phosphodiesterase class I)
MTAGTFLPMAERVGLGREIDKACVAMVFDHIRSKQGTSTSYAVNLAAPSLADSNFVTWLANTLRTAPDAATRIVFEIAEYGAVANLEATRDFVRRIAHLGARFSLDHFGRGFTSFAYLQSVPVDYLKIDSSFIRNIDTDKDNQFFVQALAKAAHDLEIKIIAENVENEAQRETLINLKIDGVQGYLVGRPAESGDAGVGVA